mmetsp:Transcript_10286/g.43000  ORF Transcript_10286/g.43000 Transcript_10286/m.43000 type:complete len:193 (-) Transcript_10286:222-800(-)|eukprot:CAMPEP_0113960830 /NCGR_PEP_ID=MMETSP0011_2-20120614/4946_1 /TAXON_ID=101924 /ORGANISM="Rhodosorus marinus" /LENGTH=192 /DNA_ID=CAMNT_0000972353 /DNA_START=237 /DNA_END=815 /DNA_ORIENTATION=+ /assembly_acc=CAM_ASM_000156
MAGTLGWLSLTLMVLSVALVEATLPRGFSKEMHCSACQRIVQEFNEEIEKEDGTAEIDTGSYRVNSQGKQTGRKKIPYKKSTLHIENVFETVCPRMTKFYRKSKSGDFFVKRELYLDLDHELNADVDDEHLSKHQLTNICNTIVDESPDDLIDLMKKADSYEALFLEVCTRMFDICTPESGGKGEESGDEDL